MKTNSSIKLFMLALVITLSVAACKKKEGPAPTPQPVEVKTITITELKALSTSASVKLPDGRKIKGIVISDASAKNIDPKTVVLQEATDQPGVIVTFDAAQTFAVGDEIEVVASNQTLAQVNGEIVLQNVPATSAKKTGTGSVTPRAVTIANINTNKAAWNGSLVSITATELTSTNGKYTGMLTIKDASGTVNSSILSGASFENSNLPASVSKITGIVRLNGNGVQLMVRSTADVVAGAITGILTESFEALKNPDGTTVMPSNSIAINDQGTGFTTQAGKWAQVVQFSPGYLVKGSTYDANFLTSERNYLYMPNTSGEFISFSHISSNFNNNAGLKSVAITFAGTTAKSIQFCSGISCRASELSFQSTDALIIGIMPVLADNKNLIGSSAWGSQEWIDNGDELSTEELELLKKLITVSPSFKTVGQWNTFEYVIPTKQELIAKGVSEENAAKFVANPQIRIYNRSSSYTKPKLDLGPIVFDKIVFKYGN